MSRLLSRLCAALAALSLMSACAGDEEVPLPDYRQDLCDLPTDPYGVASQLYPDDSSPLSLSLPVRGLRPDTTYRILAAYTVGAYSARLAGYTPILAPKAKSYPADRVRQDPVKTVAAWRGGSYINLHLEVKGTADRVHYFGFHLAGRETRADGSQTCVIRLMHDQNADSPDFSRTAWLSLPLVPLMREGLTAGRDSVRMEIADFDGPVVQTFAL